MKQKIIDIISGLSARERIMAALAFLVLLGMGLYSLVEPINTALKSRQQELKKSKDSLALLPNQLEKYYLLNARQSEIEKRYKEVTFPEGVLSYLESIIKEKGGIEKTTDYKINQQSARGFGGRYVQEPFRIELYLQSEESLAKVLYELVRGPRPLVLSRLNIKSTPNKSRLIVNLEVSSFRRSDSGDKI